jgi:hypothetical protein
MGLSSTTVWEVQTGGDDTNGSGAFDPGQTGGMFTDGAATSANTSAPVFTSASYNFVAGDAGAWVFIGSGTNWIKGWYKITSVASNAATLIGTIGSAVKFTAPSILPSTVVGCASTASPTAATWSIDYSQQAANQFTYTDLASVGAGLTVSSAAKPFNKQHVGNSLTITGGTNFTAGRYVITSIGAANVATVVGPGNMTTGAGVNGTGGMGGALASPGKCGGIRSTAGNNWTFLKSGVYTITSTTANVAAGIVSETNGGSNTQLCGVWEGYQTVRGDLGADAILRVATSGVTAVTIFNGGGAWMRFSRIQVDGLSKATIKGFNFGSSSRVLVYKCSALNCTNSGFTVGTQILTFCYATGCGTAGAAFTVADSTQLHYCEAYTNTVPGFSVTGTLATFDHCLADNNTGGTTDGFLTTSWSTNFLSCVAYANGRDGFRNQTQPSFFANCIAEANVGTGFNQTSGDNQSILQTCAVYNNGTDVGTNFTWQINGLVTGVSSFFTNASGRDFSLNNAASAGKAARAAGSPGAYFSASTTGYQDIGAAQHADPAGGVSAQAIIVRAATQY